MATSRISDKKKSRWAAGVMPYAVQSYTYSKEAGMKEDHLSNKKKIAEQRKQLAPHIHEAFQTFSKHVFADGAIPAKTKQLIAVAVAHVTQCPYCIRGHTKLALEHGNTHEEIMEAIWVAAEMRAGGAYAHSTLAIEEMNSSSSRKSV